MPPWATRDGGTDYTYCLGAENAIGAYANGLQYSLEHETVLGSPTTVELRPGETKSNVYATFAVPFDDGELDSGVSSVEQEGDGIVIHGRNGAASLPVKADSTFDAIEALIETLDGE